MNVERAISRAIDQARALFRPAFRAVLTALEKKTPVQFAQADALAGEQIQDAEVFQHYGFTSAIPPGSAVIVIPIGGRTAHSVVLGSEKGEVRFKLQNDGEVAIYTAEGDRIWFKNGRTIEIETSTLLVKASTKVRFQTPLVEMEHELKVADDIQDRVDHPDTKTMRGMRSIYNTHTHDENDINGPTDQPNQLM